MLFNQFLFPVVSSIATPALYVGRDYYPDQDKNEV